MIHPKPGEAALALIKQFEGFEPRRYCCPAGHITIGYGHVLQPGDKIAEALTPETAEALLRQDLAKLAAAFPRWIRMPLTQSMVDALASLAYNIGQGAFASSTLLARLNAGDYIGAAQQFLLWNKVRDAQNRKQPSAGLTRRRQAERELFLREGVPGD